MKKKIVIEVPEGKKEIDISFSIKFVKAKKTKAVRKAYDTVSKELKYEIIKTYDATKDPSKKIAKRFKVKTQQVAAILAWHNHRDSWGNK